MEPIHVFSPLRRDKQSQRYILTSFIPFAALLGSLAIAMGCGGWSFVQSSPTTTKPRGLPLIIGTQTLSSATVGSPYSVGLAAVGGVLPYFWEVSSGTLPVGFTLARSTGVLSGTTTQIGTFNFQVTVTDSQQTAARVSLSLLVLANPPPPLPLSIAPQIPSVTDGIPYSHSLVATGGVPPYQWSLANGSLPSGIQLYASTGVISGTTALTGWYPFTAEVTDSSGQTATRAFTLTVFRVPNVDNLYCPLTDGAPTWEETDGPAALPLVCFNTAMENALAGGPVVNVTTAAQLTTALTTASCGEIIQLQAGYVFSGNFTIPALSGCAAANNYLWIQSSAVASLPAESARYTTTFTSSDGVAHSVIGPQFGPCYAGVISLPGRPPFDCPATHGTYTAQIITPNNSPALNFTAGTSGVRLIGLEITRTRGTGEVAQLVNLGNIGNIDHIIFDRVWFHGDELVSGLQDETKRAMDASAASYIAVVDSYANDFLCISSIGACTDAQTFTTGYNSVNSTPESVWKIVNNFTEAATENVFTGGAASNTTPANLEIRLNVMWKPPIWNPADSSYNGGVFNGSGSGHPVQVKNLFELKNSQLALVEGNQMFFTWGGFSQEGYGILLTPVNQPPNTCPICEDVNVTIRYNTTNSTGAFAQLLITDTSGDIAAGGNHWSIHDNVADNVLYQQCFDCYQGESTIEQTTTYLASLSQTINNVSINHNTVVYPSVLSGAQLCCALGVTGPTIGSGNNEFNIAFTNNLMKSGKQGVSNTEGGSQPSNCANSASEGTLITNCWSPYTFDGNCFIANSSLTWPGTNVTSESYSAVFVAYDNGDTGNYTIVSGSPCKGAATDDSDPGANVAMVAAVIAGASSSIIP